MRGRVGLDGSGWGDRGTSISGDRHNQPIVGARFPRPNIPAQYLDADRFTGFFLTRMSIDLWVLRQIIRAR
jgi:hypothetical protein